MLTLYNISKSTIVPVISGWHFTLFDLDFNVYFCLTLTFNVYFFARSFVSSGYPTLVLFPHSIYYIIKHTYSDKDA